MLVWIDLETTGLHADRDHVLEIACIVTDDKLVEVGGWSHVVHHPRAHILAALDPADDEAIAAAGTMLGIDPYVVKMHLANGLWAESAASLMKIDGAQHALAEVIKSWCPDTGERSGPQLAGSTVSFDRSFLALHMPKAHALLHYRNLDTTTINELARRVWPEVHAARPSQDGANHRATGDIEYSIATAKYYAGALEPKSHEVKPISVTYGQGMVEVAPPGALPKVEPSDHLPSAGDK